MWKGLSVYGGVDRFMYNLIDSEYADFTITCTDGEYKAVRAMVLSSSEYFSTFCKHADGVGLNLTKKQARPIVEWIHTHCLYGGATDGLIFNDYVVMIRECDALLLGVLAHAFTDGAEGKITHVGPAYAYGAAVEYGLDYLAGKVRYYMRLRPACGDVAREIKLKRID